MSSRRACRRLPRQSQTTAHGATLPSFPAWGDARRRGPSQECVVRSQPGVTGVACPDWEIRCVLGLTKVPSHSQDRCRGMGGCRHSRRYEGACRSPLPLTRVTEFRDPALPCFPPNPSGERPATSPTVGGPTSETVSDVCQSVVQLLTRQIPARGEDSLCETLDRCSVLIDQCSSLGRALRQNCAHSGPPEPPEHQRPARVTGHLPTTSPTPGQARCLPTVSGESLRRRRRGLIRAERHHRWLVRRQHRLQGQSPGPSVRSRSRSPSGLDPARGAFRRDEAWRGSPRQPNRARPQ